MIVGLQDDPTIYKEYRLKTSDKLKNKPVQSLKERRIQIESCKYVDKVVNYSTENDLLNLLKEINPDIKF